MSKRNDFNFSYSVNDKSISHEKKVPGAKANDDYQSLSAQDKTDILIGIAFLCGIISLIGSLLWNLMG